MFDYSSLYKKLKDTELEPWLETLPATIAHNFDPKRWGDIPRWMEALEQLPDIKNNSLGLNNVDLNSLNLNSNSVTINNSNCTDETQQQLEEGLRLLHPWRKGPFHIAGVDINTEWHSDWKWQRLEKQISPLKGKTVLDVGSGSGYHCWRMRGVGAELVIGIEPSPLFIVQFWALQKYIQDFSVFNVPAKLEDLPSKLEGFDTTFSMGILYHRRSPLGHLFELKDTLKAGGELVLETLVIDGKEGESLVPKGRYAKMGNVWFIPSCDTLALWLEKAGFTNIRCIDVGDTTTEEQRSTDWMTFQSLVDFLDPEDHNKTIEGYPAPKRAIFIANK